MSNSSAFAVSMMIGTALRARSLRHTSNPSTRGSITSSTTRSKVPLVEAVERLLSVRGGDYLVAVTAQRIGEELLKRLLVVDQEDPWRVRRHHLP